MERYSISASLVLLIISPLMAENASGYSDSSRNNFNRNSDSGGYQSFRNPITSSGNLDGGSQTRTNDQGAIGANISGPKVFRHISLFVAPKEENSPTTRVIHAQQGKVPDKHYQIIFVKAPSGGSSQHTEIQLSPQPQLKTLVYVLVKKREESGANVRIKSPVPTKPPPPEVFFIKYKDSKQGGREGEGGRRGNGGNLGGGAIPVRASGSLSTNYGIQ